MFAGVRDLLVVEMGQSFVAANKKAINRMIVDAAARVRSKAAAASIGAGAPEAQRSAAGGQVMAPLKPEMLLMSPPPDGQSIQLPDITRTCSVGGAPPEPGLQRLS